MSRQYQVAAAGAPSTRAFRAIWRWHFYAGLIVAPFLLILAVTGAIYLFNVEIEDALHPEMRLVTPMATRQPVSRLVHAALAARPGKVTRIDLPATPDRSAIVFVTPAAGDPVQVAVDPGTGRVLGSFVYARTLVGLADTLHTSLMLGYWGGVAIELAACWAIVLIATGLYLWWPRGRRGAGGLLYPRLHLRGRMLWRDVHATIGVWAVALIGFLLLTGLPWTQVEGPLMRSAVQRLGAGYPPSHGKTDVPSSVPMKAALGKAPWTLEGAPMPVSDDGGHAGHDMGGGGADAAAVAGLDRVVAMLARDHGLVRGYRLFPPTGPTGVYTAYTYPDRPEGQRSFYFDRYSERLIRQVDYADYGVAAKAIELGVQLHMGNYFGRANQIVMLATCIAIVLLVVSGIAMWWKRRPAGRLAAPGRVPDAPIRGAVALLAVGCVLMPVLGVSVLAVLLLDRLVVRVQRA